MAAATAPPFWTTAGEPDGVVAACLQVLHISQNVLVEPAGQVRAGFGAGRRHWTARARWPGEVAGEMAGQKHTWRELALRPEAGWTPE